MKFKVFQVLLLPLIAFLAISFFYFKFQSIDVLSQGKSCGNGVCQNSGGGILEDCNNCPQDCGVCITPTPTPPTQTQTPTPTPTPTINPEVTQTPTPTPQDDSSQPQTNDQDSGTDTSQNQLPTPTPTPIPSPAISVNDISVDDNNPTTISISADVEVYFSEVIELLEVSIDNGQTWRLLPSSNIINEKITNLDDGNYEVIIRVTDSVGNTTQSFPKTIIVDRLPPILGGGQFSFGPIALSPKEGNLINFVKNVPLKFAISTKGGVTDLKIESEDNQFNLNKLEGSQIFSGDISFNNPGLHTFRISAVDGADNKTDKEIYNINVFESGKVTDEQGSQVNTFEMSVFQRYERLKTWVLWDGKTFNQENPKKYGSGNYNLILPRGIYYIVLKDNRGINYQSRIFEVEQTKIINSQLIIKSSSKQYQFLSKVPIINKFLPPQELEMKTPTTQDASYNFESLYQGALKAGNILPEIEVDDSDFERSSLSNLINRPTIISFVANWSSLSQQQLKVLSDIKGELAEEVSVYVVHVQENNSFSQIVKSKGAYKYEAFSDEFGLETDRLDISVLPQHFLVDGNKNIKEIFWGFYTKEKLMDSLKKVI